MTESDRQKIMNLADDIQGEINRMCVTEERTELNAMYRYAERNLKKLWNMVYDARFGDIKMNEITT